MFICRFFVLKPCHFCRKFSTCSNQFTDKSRFFQKTFCGQVFETGGGGRYGHTPLFVRPWNSQNVLYCIQSISWWHDYCMDNWCFIRDDLCTRTLQTVQDEFFFMNFLVWSWLFLFASRNELSQQLLIHLCQPLSIMMQSFPDSNWSRYLWLNLIPECQSIRCRKPHWFYEYYKWFNYHILSRFV